MAGLCKGPKSSSFLKEGLEKGEATVNTGAGVEPQSWVRNFELFVLGVEKSGIELDGGESTNVAIAF